MGFVDKFKQFIARGNVIDLAVAVIIGGAFGGIVNSLVADVLTPPIGFLLGHVKFEDLKVQIGRGLIDNPVTINYGKFLQVSFNFIIVAFCVFLLVELVHKLQRKKEETPATPPEPSAEVKLLTEIRDLLKEKGGRPNS
jgi:large conductance mechanosensitive channel